MDDLDLVERVAKTIRSSVQLQLAWGLESVRSWGGPILVLRLLLWGSWNMVVVVGCWNMVVVVGNWSLSWLLVTIVVNWSWLVVVVMDWGRGRSYSASWSRGRVLLAERWVVPAWIVLSILVALVIEAAALMIKISLILWLRLCLGLVLLLRTR